MSHINRHLERDIFSKPSTPPSQPIAAGSTFTMLWPAWEGGFGDLVMWTILPVGYALHEGSLPNGTLGISGALYTRAWHPVLRARNVCTFERDDWYQVPDGANTIRERVHNPLPRCATAACYETVHLCEPKHGGVRGVESWIGQRELDARIGFPRLPPLPLTGSSRLEQPQPVGREQLLRVVFARRMSWHGRSLLNAANLTSACERMVLTSGGATWRVVCQLLSFGSMPIRRAISALRDADVLVSMHGADVINGLHLAPGRAVVEIVNHRFDDSADYAPFWFVSCFERHLTPVYQHKRIVLAPVLRGEQTPQRAWNLNATLPPSVLQQVLTSVVARDGQTRFHEASDDVARAPAASVRWHHDNARVAAADAAAVDGYCSFTDENEGDCDAGDKGSFAIGGTRLPLLPAWCTAACLSCPRCRAVSFSADNKDCSWFNTCDLTRLHRNPGGFRTWRVRKRRRAATQ